MQTLKDVNVKDLQLKFSREMTLLRAVNRIIIHHSGTPTDSDLGAIEIHRMHQRQGWVGIGYHFVIRKSGTIELGRPIKYMGAHAQGANADSIGIHFSGNFEIGSPTNAQIENGAVLCAAICNQFSLNPNRSILGHRNVMATACPGRKLYQQLNTLKGKTVWYMERGW